MAMQVSSPDDNANLKRKIDELTEDEAAIRQRHAASPAVLRALDEARDLLF